MARSTKAILIAVVAVAATIACLKLHERGVKRRCDEKLAHMIQTSVDAAGSKNQQAVRVCEAEINTILAQHFPEVARQGQKTAKDIATYGSCCKIVYSLAKDKIKGSNTTGQYLDTRMQAHLDRPLRKLSGDLETAIGRFELSLRENTVGLARDLAQMNPHNPARTISLPLELQSNTDIDKAIKNLGISGVTIGASIPWDVWFVLNTQLVKPLASKAATTAALLFATDAVEAATEAAIAAEGPETFFIADIIAFGGALWTLHDISSTRKKFEREMKRSLDNIMPDVRRDIQKQGLDDVHAMLKEHQRLQDEIRQRAVQECARD